MVGIEISVTAVTASLTVGENKPKEILLDLAPKNPYFRSWQLNPLEYSNALRSLDSAVLSYARLALEKSRVLQRNLDEGKFIDINASVNQLPPALSAFRSSQTHGSKT